MNDFVQNPRRAPRASVALVARATLLCGRYWDSPTVDCGPGGCQLVASGPCEPGQRIFLAVQGAALPEPSWLTGHVAWAGRGPERRIGVVYDGPSRAAAALLFERIAAACPELLVGSRAPRRVPLGARISPGVTPDPTMLRPREVELVQEIGDGMIVAALRERLGEKWGAFVNPLFSLLDRSHLVVEHASEHP